jgi:hypothetical protein
VAAPGHQPATAAAALPDRMAAVAPIDGDGSTRAAAVGVSPCFRAFFFPLELEAMDANDRLKAPPLLLMK